MALKIKTKLTIIVFATVLVTAVILGYSLFADREIGAKIERKELELIDMVSNVEDIAFDKILAAHKIIEASQHHLYDRISADRNKSLAHLKSIVKEFKVYAGANDNNFRKANILIKDIIYIKRDMYGFDNYIDRYEELLNSIKDIKKSHHQFMGDVSKMLDAVYVSEIESYELLERMVDERGGKLYYAIRGLSRNVDGLMRDELAGLASARAVRHRVTNYMLILLLLVLVLDKLFVCKRVFVPIENTIERISKLSKGISVPKVEVKRTDEIGELLASVNRIIDSDEKIKNQMLLMSQGDYKVDVSLRSEEDSMGMAMQRMIESSRAIDLAANRIADGDYSEGIKIRGKHDYLGRAIDRMLDSLMELRRDNERQMWFLEGRVELNEAVHDDLDVNTMSNDIVTYLCKRLGAQIGTLYLMRENNKLFLTGSYALLKEDYGYAEVMLGEGVVGQAALNKEPIIVTEVPADYLKIGSSIGESCPRNIIALPFIFEKRVKGVIELGAFREFTDDDIEFLDSVTSRIALAINLCQARGKMKELLEETQRQAEELESQQTRLEMTNAELEEKAYDLEMQRDEIAHKTEDLERAQFNLQRQANDLSAASKYKTEFLANMSHELRTPLNSLLILAQDLKENKKKNLRKDQVQAMEFIYKSGNELLMLINDILDLSKVEAGQVDMIVDDLDLDDIANDIDDMFRHMANKKGLEFKVEISDDIPKKIHSDRQKMEQVLKNLVSNAIKFTEKGEVVVSFHRPSPDVDLSLSNLLNDKAIAISVTDTGIGISEVKHRGIFEAFRQVDGSISRKYGGTGLGLSISMKMARLLDGELHITSEKGKGSTFTLYISPELNERHGRTNLSPVSAQIEEVGSKLLDDRNKIKEGDRVILIADTDKLISGKIIKFCRKNSFKVIYTDKGSEAIELSIKYMPKAIILGDDMCGTNGIPIIEALKKDTRTRHIPIHLLSSENSIDSEFHRCSIGYTMKPINREKIEEMLSAVENHLSKEVKRLLIVEDDEDLRKHLVELIGNNDVVATDVGTGKEALKCLMEDDFDCVILDLGLPDMYGLDLLKEIERITDISNPYIIVNTGVDLSRDDEQVLRKYTSSIIVKSEASQERLLDETAMFLHRVVDNLPEHKKNLIKKIHDKDAIFKSKNILIVDDDMRNLFAISKVLEDRGVVVHEATNGQEALDYLDLHPDIDLVLMDIMMPVMDGYEAIHYIRKQDRFQDLPILTLTAKAMKEDRYKSISVGANDYLSKPVDIEQLLSLMRVWLYN